jgi:GT2 family glycosyltransferase
MKKIAIVIPVHNNLEFTRKSIRKLSELISRTRFQNSVFLTLVIDDGSTDGTAEWLADNHPEVVVLKGNGHLWWSGGVNLGARYAVEEREADYILLWNNDIIPATDYFAELDKLVGELGDRTIAGSKILYFGKDHIIWSCGGLFNPRSGVKEMVGYNLPDSPAWDRMISVDWLPGMGTLVPAAIIRHIGYWDAEAFPQYHGDSDFTFRAKTAGYHIHVYPQLRLWNDKSSSGLTHGDSLGGLIRSLTSIRSNFNVGKNILFYRRHATSVLAYRFLAGYYFRLIGGFMKWKLLALFGAKRCA